MDRKLPPRDARSVIALNERHLRHLIGDYIHYHEQDRIHDSLDKDTPNRRSVERKPATWAGVISLPRLGGCTIGMFGARQHRTGAARLDCPVC